MPQKGWRPKVAKRQGEVVRRSVSQNKESLTVHMVWDLSGHMYGVQLILKRSTLTEDLAADAPRGARAFDDVTDVIRRQSRYCLLTRTSEGMQTEESFNEWLQHLDKQITARSEADVAAGATAIRCPVVLTVDNHASRFSDEALAKCTGQAAAYGIRLFTEEPKTSGFLQSLDQYKSSYHRAYNKGLRVYKTAYESLYGQPLASVGLVDFLRVMGGDETLHLPGMWFTWCDPFDVIRAWQKVGITGNKLVPELISRSEFIDREQSQGMAAAAAAAAAAPAAAPAPARRATRAADL